MPEMWDVAIAGAGPAGSASAYLLATQGYRVLLLDRAHFPRPKACAEYLSPGVAQMLTRLGLTESILSTRSLPVPGMDIVSPRGSIMRVQYQSGAERLVASTVPRHALDDAMLVHAERAGVEVRQGWYAKAPILEEGVVRGFYGIHDGRATQVRARLCVVADGCRSSLARALGLSRPARWPVRLGLVAHYRGSPVLDSGFGQMHVDRHGYCGIAPLPDGLVNVALVIPTDGLRRAGLSATAFLERWIARSPRLRDSLTGCERVTPVRGVAPIGSRTRRAWAPGVLLVGDAASFFDPFTGEGIYRALKGAEIAALVAHRALGDVRQHHSSSGDRTGASLAEYDAERSRAFRRKEMVTALVQLFVQYPSLMEYALPRLQRRRTPAEALCMVLGDVRDASAFLRPRMLWSALRP